MEEKASKKDSKQALIIIQFCLLSRASKSLYGL